MDLSHPIVRLERKEHRLFFALGALVVGFNLLVSGIPFFWDNILNCKLATWYYEQEHFQLFVPGEWDAGHPPFFNIYLAEMWQVFGKNLLVSHLAMLPFVLGTLWQLLRLAKCYLPAQLLPLAMAFCLLEPTYLAQNSLVSPDLVLVFGYLWGLNSILAGKRLHLLLAMLLLAGVSFRGILMLPALTFSELLLPDREGKLRLGARIKALFSLKQGVPAVWPYVTAALLVILWLLAHRQAAGWLFSPPAETYGEHRQMVGFGGMIRNFAILGWRFLDFGRVFLWIFAGIAAFVFWRKKDLFSPQMRQVLILFAVPTVLLSVFFLPFSNPIGHRYYMVSFLLFSFILAMLLGKLPRCHRRWVSLSLLMALVGGHFWVYPNRIAQGWDASLAHVPWHFQQEVLRAHIRSKGWEGHVCASFPALAERRYLDPGVDPADNWPELQDKDDPDSRCSYILYTPYSNGFSDEEIQRFQDMKPLFEVDTGPIRSAIYPAAGL